MIIFWLIIAAMTLLAMGFTALPWLELRKTGGADAGPPSTSLRVNGVRKRQDPCRSATIKCVVVLTLAIPILAISLYLKLGASSKVAQYQQTIAQDKVIQAEIQRLGSIQNIITALQDKVATAPDGQGFALLGKLYLKTQQFTKASNAFAKAKQLLPDQPEILVGYAESLYFLNHETLTPDARQMLAQSLQLQPNQPDAINLLALDAYQHGDYRTAIKHWEQLLSQAEPGSTTQQQLLQMVAMAQKKATMPAVGAIKLKVQVNIAKQLQKQIDAQDTLFVYAQAVDGPPMPLAVVRKHASDLPAAIILDETMAMTPNATLADYKQVRVVARITSSGQAIAAAGDLQGSSAVVDVKHPPAKIVVNIDKRLGD